MASAAAAPTMASELGSCSGSAESTMAMIWVSCRKPSGNSGRIGRSIRRLVRISFSEGRPSRLIKPPGNLAGGVSVLAVIDGEREKAGARLRLVGHTGGDQDHRVAGTNDDSAVRLFGHLTGFQGDLPAAQVYFNYVMHAFLKPPTSAGNQFR